MAEEYRYKKVSSGGGFVRQKIFFGEDHMLVIDGQYTETYRRLYFDDIQAVVRCGNGYSIVLRVFLIIFMMFSAIGMLSSTDFFNWGALIFFVIFLSFLLNSFWCKGSCDTAVKTPLQLVRLPSLNNVRKAEKFEAKLTEAVENKQGRLTSEVLQEALYGSQ
ncbi:MAG: hypothetical protein AAFX93_00135 [Verrucomicrobiota bacterium]